MKYIPYTIDDEYEAVILNSKSEMLPITKMISEFSVYYDLFSNSAKITMVIQDGIGMLEKLPIIGDEQVVISFKTPTLEVAQRIFYEDIKTLIFQVYRVADRIQSSAKSSTYVLHGISLEGINNMRYSVYRSYVDMPAEAIVEDIYREYLSPTHPEHNFKSPKPVVSDASDGRYTYLYTGEKPFTAIARIGMEAKRYASTKSSNYIFFEDSKQWNFRTIDELITANRQLRDADRSDGIVQDFYFVDPRHENDNTQSIFGKPIRPDQKALSFHITRQMDNAENLKRGLFYNTTQTIDTITKRFTNDPFIYDKHRGDIAHLENIHSTTRPHVHGEDSIYESDRSATKYDEFNVKNYLISHLGSEYNDTSVFSAAVKARDGQLRNPRKLHEFYKFDYASRVKLNNIALEFAIPGNTDLDVGQLVNINIMGNNLQSQEISEQLAYNRLFGNEQYGGYFLITNLRHVYTAANESFITHFSCVKDVYMNTHSAYSTQDEGIVG